MREKQIEHKKRFILGNTEQVRNVSFLILGHTPFRSQSCLKLVTTLSLSLSLSPPPGIRARNIGSPVYRYDVS